MIEEKLNTLSEFQSQKDVSILAKQEAIDSVLTPEIKAQLESIDTEFATMDEAVDTNIKELTAEIKEDVLGIGETVRGDFLLAIYSKPRITWDGKKLSGMADMVPNILKAQKIGNPSVSIRIIK